MNRCLQAILDDVESDIHITGIKLLAAGGYEIGRKSDMPTYESVKLVIDVFAATEGYRLRRSERVQSSAATKVCLHELGAFSLEQSAVAGSPELSDHYARAAAYCLNRLDELSAVETAQQQAG